MPKKEIPLVTVLMSVYNSERYVREAVESILGQTFTDFEFIIVDDGSIDRSLERLQAYDDPRIIIIRNEKNIGLAASLNKGMEIARGEFIARMDADDVSLPNRIERQVKFLQDRRDIGVLGTYIKHIDFEGNQKGVTHNPTTHHSILWRLCFTSPLSHPSVVFRASVVKSVGGYNSTLMVNQDRDLWQRLSMETRFANIPEELLLYRVHQQQISVKKGDIQAQNSAKVGLRMIANIIGPSVPFGSSYFFRTGRYESVEDIVQAGRIIRPLFDAFVSKFSLSVKELNEIRRDAVFHYLQVAKALWPRPEMIEFAWSALALSPPIFFSKLRKKTELKSRLETFEGYRTS